MNATYQKPRQAGYTHVSPYHAIPYSPIYEQSEEASNFSYQQPSQFMLEDVFDDDVQEFYRPEDIAELEQQQLLMHQMNQR